MPPVNDNFADAIAITLNSSVSGSNIDATLEEGESPHGGVGEASIWYKLSLPESAFSTNVTVSTDGSSFDTYLSVYTGTSVSDLVLVAEDDDSGEGTCSRLALSLSGGTYYIAVSGYGGDIGDVNLSVTGTVSYIYNDNSPPALPIHISNMPNVFDRAKSGRWMLGDGDGKVSAIYVRSTAGGYVKTRIVTFSVVSDTSITQGAYQEHVESPYGGTGNRDASFSCGSGRVLSPAKTNLNSFSVISVSGLSSSQVWYKTTNPVFGGFAFSYSAGSVYVPSSGRFLLGIEGALTFEGSYGKYRIWAISLPGASVFEHGYSDRIFPAGVGFSYPEANFCSACGSENRAVYFVKNSSNQMVFFYVDSVDLSLSAHFQCSDLTGTPLAFSADIDSERFIAIYYKDSKLKAVYGEITDDSFVFSSPVVLADSDQYQFAGVCWITGRNSFTACFTSKSNSRFTILNCKVTNFSIIPDYGNHKTYAIRVDTIPCCFYDKSLDRVLIGIYGDGSSYAPVNLGSYVIITDSAIGDIVLFWQNRLLHGEAVSGMVTKQPTLTVAPGTPGQPYVPPTPAIPSKTSYSYYSRTECKKVG